jgi:hypothetical protein
MKQEQLLHKPEWCRQAIDECWKHKVNNIHPQERLAAEAAYNNARRVYEDIIRESSND